MNGKQLDSMIRDTFNLGSNDPITPKQLNYVMASLVPSNYLLQHHRVKGKPVTYSVPNYDSANALAHRPWQLEPLNDTSRNVVIRKARQLGFSEVGIAQLIWFCDVHSSQNVKALYTFPTYKSLKTFYKTRISPEFESGYYSTLSDDNHMSQEQMSIRNSTLIFRSSSKGSSMEGIDVDFVSLDEYDR